MKAYLDASALTSLLLIDSGTATMERWIAEVGPTLSVSDFGWGEFVSALSIRVRAGVAASETASALLIEHQHNVRH